MRASVLGIFVGGASSRMGQPKGRLPAPDSGQPLVTHLAAQGEQAGLVPVLVGPAEAYTDIRPDLSRVPDTPPHIGPLGGLAAVLSYAEGRFVVAVGCDMPYVEASLLQRMASDPSDGAVLAARHGPDGPWEPLLARYDPARVSPVVQSAVAEGVRSFQRLFARLHVEALELDSQLTRALVDWDVPGDLPE